MNEETAVIATESATVLPELSSLSPEQRQTWRETGEMPKKQDSAPAKETPPADSAPQTKETADAPDSAPDRKQPHLKTKEDTEKRFREILEENRRYRERVEALEKRPSEPVRKQDSPPVPEEKKAPAALREFLEKWTKDPANKEKTYEEGVEAWQLAREAWRDQEHQRGIQQAIFTERQRIQQESATKELQTKLTDAKQRYGEEETNKIFPALGELLQEQQIPVAVKAILNESENLVDVMYVLSSDPAEWATFMALAKQNPGAAIRKIALTEHLVEAELGKKAPARAEDGKFAKAAEPKPEKKEAAEPQSKAPRPPREIGGTQSEPEDPVVAAVKANDFRSAKAEFTRQYAAQHR